MAGVTYELRHRPRVRAQLEYEARNPAGALGHGAQLAAPGVGELEYRARGQPRKPLGRGDGPEAWPLAAGDGGQDERGHPDGASKSVASQRMQVQDGLLGV